MATKKKTDETENTVEATSAETEAVETQAAAAEEAPKKAPAKKAAKAEKAADSGDGDAKTKKGKRAEKIGVVASDKMTKTVVVRVDRLVKHPIYRKYVRKRKKFRSSRHVRCRQESAGAWWRSFRRRSFSFVTRRTGDGETRRRSHRVAASLSRRVAK